MGKRKYNPELLGKRKIKNLLVGNRAAQQLKMIIRILMHDVLLLKADIEAMASTWRFTSTFWFPSDGDSML